MSSSPQPSSPSLPQLASTDQNGDIRAQSPTKQAWDVDPRRAFDDWLALQRFRTSSVLVYRAQWHHFLDWLAARGRTLRGAEPALIDEFAATIDVKRQQRARYLRIMERVFDDMTGQSQAQGNPARAVTRRIDAPWTDTVSNAPTGFLDATERGRLWEELARTISPEGQVLPWRDLRDRAMAAMLLGAGLKLNELESMHLRQLRIAWMPPNTLARTDSDAKPERADDAPALWSPEQETDERGGVVLIPRAAAGGNGRAGKGSETTSKATTGGYVHDDAEDADSTVGVNGTAGGDGQRTVPFPAHAAEILLCWLRARTDQGVEGELVFPAGRSGLKMHKATALRAIDALVERCGLHASHHGRISPQTLRNAFAAALFTAGHTDEQVAERLGMIKTLSARRLRAAWDLARAAPAALAAGEGATSARPSRRRDNDQKVR
ncbi:tyrosine-type recombinase/integrase [Robbsia andropogonis]|uniref:tyrosine-type recombinase/integrase n=1 Tax=Robbsia andropogonis TaxID=28092 RepID=UPI00046598B1|nr:tyrosine-type recombinase/integrase [Robbsia andropogonis]MCP1119957.1 tyrosine-type recombinase/integrase [Robbsia andropogonis]MCP1129827.1 tyrosine-type recombinase/integrase [Robbsia andropogonis]